MPLSKVDEFAKWLSDKANEASNSRDSYTVGTPSYEYYLGQRRAYLTVLDKLDKAED